MKSCGRNLNVYSCVKEANIKRLHTYGTNDKAFWRKQNCGTVEGTVVAMGLRERCINRWNTEGF